MTPEQKKIFEAMSEIPESMIAEMNEPQVFPTEKRRILLGRIAAAGSIAACLAVTATIFYSRRTDDILNTGAESPAVTELTPQARTAEADTTHAVTEQTATDTTTVNTAPTASAEPEGRTNFTTDGKGAAAQSSAPPVPNTTVTITTTSAATTTEAAATTTTTTTLPLNAVSYTPPFYRWHDFNIQGLEETYTHRQRREAIILDILPNIEFGWAKETIDIRENGEVIEKIGNMQLENGVEIEYNRSANAYFTDLTGDGIPELCVTGHFSDQFADDDHIVVYDVMQHREYTLWDREYYNYALNGSSGALLVERKRAIYDYTKKGIPWPDLTQYPEYTVGTLAIENDILVFKPLE